MTAMRRSREHRVWPACAGALGTGLTGAWLAGRAAAGGTGARPAGPPPRWPGAACRRPGPDGRPAAGPRPAARARTGGAPGFPSRPTRRVRPGSGARRGAGRRCGPPPSLTGGPPRLRDERQGKPREAATEEADVPRADARAAHPDQRLSRPGYRVWPFTQLHAADPAELCRKRCTHGSAVLTVCPCSSPAGRLAWGSPKPRLRGQSCDGRRPGGGRPA